MRLQLIACEIMFREVSHYAATSPHVIDAVFLSKGYHDNADTGREKLQELIDATDEKIHDAVVLGYCLCSNMVVGLQARGIPVIIPRAHDCISLFMGSKDTYAQYFRDKPGTYFVTAGWIERNDAHVERTPAAGEGMGKTLQEFIDKYGEENGRFLYEFENQWQKNYTTGCYIEMPLSHREDVREEAKQSAAKYGWEYCEMAGSERLFAALVNGQWPEQDFLTIKPGQSVVAQYNDEIIVAV
jgi:hypothetical protein